MASSPKNSPSTPPPSSNSTAPSGSAESPPAPPPPSLLSSPPPTSPSASQAPPAPKTSSSPPPPLNNNDSPPPPPPPSSSGSSSSSSNDVDTKVVLGVVLSAGLLLFVFIVCSARCFCQRKKKRKHQEMQYYPSAYDPKAGANQQYYKPNPPWLNGTQRGEHFIQVNPQSGTGGWGAGAASPPTFSGESGSNYSGPFHPPPMPPPSPPNIALGFNKSTFSYEELAAATEGFSHGNLLGQGGFGYVHKGVLPNGKEVAVKSLKSGSGQGEREFQAEVEIISRVHHRYLVSLVGYCIAGGQRMLVYDYVPNDTLEHHLHVKDLPVMDFSTRLRIALGSAKGLAYLHEDCHPRIIHRDIKAANILLDYNFEAKVADFGLAKLSSDNYTHVSTRVMGTFGYLAPEYASSGKLTDKSDVFSFGVMLLELITGRRPVDPNNVMDESLVDWARPLLTRALEDGNFDELVDSRLERNYDHQEMQRMIGCAAASIRHSARKRPKMSQIVRALEGDSSMDDLNEGVKPGQSSIFSSGVTSEYNASTYNADLQKFRQLALASQEIPSSEYGTSSSDNHSAEMVARAKQNSNF